MASDHGPRFPFQLLHLTSQVSPLPRKVHEPSAHVDTLCQLSLAVAFFGSIKQSLNTRGVDTVQHYSGLGFFFRRAL
jgi:hypothetical protein